MQSAYDQTPSSRAVLAGYVLPGDVSLTHAFSTIFQGLRASGCGLAAANAWLFLARSTSPAAWFETCRLPINWRKHATLARETGVSERRLNQVVHELATHGALTRLTPENGYRGYVPGEADGDNLERSYGLCFGPAIRNFAAFAKAAEAERRCRAEIAQIKEDLRAAIVADRRAIAVFGLVAGTGIVDVDPGCGFHAGPQHLLLRDEAAGVHIQEPPHLTFRDVQATSFSIDTIRPIVDWHW